MKHFLGKWPLLRNRKLWIIAIFMASPFLAWLGLGLAPKPPLLAEIPFGKIVLAKNGEILKISLSADDKYRLRVGLDEVAPEAVSALLHYEDRHFQYHPGVNPFSLGRAVLSMHGGRRVGASTITMQVARLRYGLRTNTISGKLWQIGLALLLERHYSKSEILEAFFNLAPYGGNIEGIEAAARIYFDKPASLLTPLESMALCIVPQNPVGRHPVSGHSFDTARARLEADLAGSKGEVHKVAPLKVRHPADLPFAAQHLSLELLGTITDGKNAKTGVEPYQLFTMGKDDKRNDILFSKFPNDLKTRIHTGIEPDLQRMLVRSLQNFTSSGKRYGIENASALLVNIDTMEVAAHVGSANFFDRGIAGQVDGTKARRSPGSTLKPFIYALALEQGLIHPMTMLADSPRSFGGYDPENFDRGFRGPLPAHEALKASRNLPAIALAGQLEYPGLYGFLQKGGVKLARSAEYYGLALALGGAEVSMRELAALYAMLANQGLWQPLRFHRDQPSVKPERLLSPEASWLTVHMLKREGKAVRTKGGDCPIYYKTGTSNGMRDAWTAGIAGNYVLVVWVGNFDGRANPYFVGAITALPLFEEIAAGIGSLRKLKDRHGAEPAGRNLQKALFCVSTGDFFSGQCARTEEAFFIPGVSPIRDSGIIRKVLVDRQTGLRSCHASENTDDVWWEFWPTEMRKIFAQAGINKPAPPEWEPQCLGKAVTMAGISPKIMLPKKNVVYRRKISENAFKLPLQASADPDAKNIHWYAGSEYLGSARPGEIFIWNSPQAGEYEIMAVDDRGRSSRQICRVAAMP